MATVKIRPQTKTCHKCKKRKPFTADHFGPHSTMPFGLRNYCRACSNADSRAYYKDYRHDLRYEVLSHYSGGVPACHCCETRVWEHLALDHLQGSSQEDYRKHGKEFFAYLKREGFPKHFTVSCHNCNTARSILGRCPHQGPPDEGFYARKGRTRTVVLAPLSCEPDEKITRRCNKCERVFLLDSDHFSRHATVSGYRTNCKECQHRYILLNKRKNRAAAKLEVMTHYSGGTPCCGCCGETCLAFLTIDHLNGGGTEHRRREKIGDICEWLVKHGLPEGYTVLCANCNQAAGFYGRCPCQDDKP